MVDKSLKIFGLHRTQKLLTLAENTRIDISYLDKSHSGDYPPGVFFQAMQENLGSFSMNEVPIEQQNIYTIFLHFGKICK